MWETVKGSLSWKGFSCTLQAHSSDTTRSYSSRSCYKHCASNMSLPPGHNVEILGQKQRIHLLSTAAGSRFYKMNPSLFKSFRIFLWSELFLFFRIMECFLFNIVVYRRKYRPIDLPLVRRLEASNLKSIMLTKNYSRTKHLCVVFVDSGILADDSDAMQRHITAIRSDAFWLVLSIDRK